MVDHHTDLVEDVTVRVATLLTYPFRGVRRAGIGARRAEPAGSVGERAQGLRRRPPNRRVIDVIDNADGAKFRQFPALSVTRRSGRPRRGGQALVTPAASTS